MRRVRDVCLDAYSYQVPPELLREDLGRRGEERERLFDVWFQLERAWKEKFDMRGLAVEPYDEGKEVTRIELSMCLTEMDQEIGGLFEYDDQLFTAETTAQMLEDYLRLLSVMAANPERDLSAFSLAGAAGQIDPDLVANLEL
jgi:non-ribosomal peptide synthetase component F